jgi:hypothetical protein
MPAAALTCLATAPSAGDILPRLARAQAACVSANPRALAACREPLAAAAAQLAYLQGRVESALAILTEALSLTSDVVPASHHSLGTETAEPALLAQAFADLEAARSVAERTLAIFPATR